MADLDWFAGMFEGEGTATITMYGRGYTRPIVTLTSTDRSIVEAFDARWPGVRTTRQPPGNARLAYIWTLNVRAACRKFAVDLLPYVRTARVRRKLELLIVDVDARRKGSRDPNYRQQCLDRRDEMRALNRRGALPAGDTP